MTVARMLTLAILLLHTTWTGTAMQARAETPNERRLTVCELMADLNAYSNRVVTVVGEYMSDPEHFSIGAESCEQPFKTFGYEWPTALQLRLVGGRDTPSKVPFEADTASIESFYHAVRELKALSVQGCIEVTGMVQMKDDYSPTFTMRGGQKRGLGFGHMNSLPGQLIVKTVHVLSLQAYNPATRCMCCNR